MGCGLTPFYSLGFTHMEQSISPRSTSMYFGTEAYVVKAMYLMKLSNETKYHAFGQFLPLKFFRALVLF